MDLEAKPSYSQEAIKNRAILEKAYYPLILYVEDKDKEYVYEGILKRMYPINERVNDKILDFVNIIGLGGKEEVKKKIQEQGSKNANIKQQYVYLLDGDFDRYICPNLMMSGNNIVYLEAYCIESYFIDEIGCMDFIQGKTEFKNSDIKQSFLFDEWKSKIVNESKDLFLSFACCRQYRIENNKSVNIPKGVSQACRQLDKTTGFIDVSKKNLKIDEIKTLINDYDNRVAQISNLYEKKYGDNYFYFICGKFLFQSLVYYISNQFPIIQKNPKPLFEELRKNFDINQLNILKDCLDKNLKELEVKLS